MSATCPACGEDAADALDCPRCGEGLSDVSAEPRGSATAPAVVFLVVLFGLVAVCVLAGGIMAVAVPNLMQARRAGNEVAAVGALMSIAGAQVLYREADKDQNGVLDYGDLHDLGQAQLLDQALGSGVKQGYLFEVHPSTTSPESLWLAEAQPAVPGTTGSRYFAVSQDGVIYFSETAPIPLDDETCQPPQERLESGDIQPLR